MKATTMLLNVVQLPSTPRFYRKHYLLPNLIENQKSWKHGHNGPNVTVPYKTQNFWPLLCKDEEKLRHFLLQGFIPTHSQATIRRRGQIRVFSGFFSFFFLHFSELCHHKFQKRVKTSIFDKNQKGIARWKATTVLFNWVHSYSTLRFHRKLSVFQNLPENRKCENPFGKNS